MSARLERLDPDQVLVAAERLVAANGWENLTMAALAADLGVRPPSLYRHVDSLADHPLVRMLDAGLAVSVHSDDPAYFRGYMNENFVCTQEEGGLGKDEVVQLSRNAFESTWLPRSLKDGYLTELDTYAGH